MASTRKKTPSDATRHIEYQVSATNWRLMQTLTYALIAAAATVTGALFGFWLRYTHDAALIPSSTTSWFDVLVHLIGFGLLLPTGGSVLALSTRQAIIQLRGAQHTITQRLVELEQELGLENGTYGRLMQSGIARKLASIARKLTRTVTGTWAVLGVVVLLKYFW